MGGAPGGETPRVAEEGRARLAACKTLGIWLPAKLECLWCEGAHIISISSVLHLYLPATRLQTLSAASIPESSTLLQTQHIHCCSSTVKALRHQSQSWRKRGGARDDDDDDTHSHAIEQRCARRRRRDRCRAGYGRSAARCRGAAHPHRSRPARRACCFGHKTTRCCASRPTCAWTACTIV